MRCNIVNLTCSDMKKRERRFILVQRNVEHHFLVWIHVWTQCHGCCWPGPGGAVAALAVRRMMLLVPLCLPASLLPPSCLPTSSPQHLHGSRLC